MMTNTYHGEIVQLLLRCGKGGMRVADISRFVFNKHCGFFNDDLTFDSLHQTLRCYLWRQSTLRRSPFRRLRHGVYAIKEDMALQLDFDFDRPIEQDEEEEIKVQNDAKEFKEDPRQLLLFPDLF